MLTKTLFALTVLSLTACSSTAPQDYALRHDDWQTWCALNSEEAKQGDKMAMNNVGTCYLEGLGGFPQDRQIAMQWFLESANRGNKTAEINLSQINIPTQLSEGRAQVDIDRLMAALPKN